MHPRTLVGKQVPSMSGEGTETLQNTADAREWQEAVKDTLVQEIESRAGVRMQDSRQFLETIHASIDLFKNNPDLTPGSKGFDKDLADKFAALAKPYEVRIEGKLHGYSIPVQPLIDNLRMQVKPKTAAEIKEDKPAAAPDEPPQKGISSKAPTTGEQEDFSTLFGTIGLPNLRI